MGGKAGLLVGFATNTGMAAPASEPKRSSTGG